MASIRWKILLAFFLIVGLSFFVAATTLTGLVSDYLFDQRTRDDSLKTEKLALAAAPLFQSVSANELNDMLEENAASMDGRLLLIDNDGKIQYDTFQNLCGQRIQVDEALRVLAGDAAEAYGIHAPGRAVVEEMSGESGAEYVAYSVHEMTGFQGKIGAALFVSRVTGAKGLLTFHLEKCPDPERLYRALADCDRRLLFSASKNAAILFRWDGKDVAEMMREAVKVMEKLTDIMNFRES